MLTKFVRSARKLFNTNIWPAASFAAGGMGTSPTSINKMRAAAGIAALGKGGQCTTTAIALAFKYGSDPAIKIRLEIVRQWLAIWVLLSDDEKSKVRHVWPKHLRRLQPVTRWSVAKGPIGAVIATLTDIGWKAVAPDCWREPAEDGLWWKFTGQ